MAVDSHIQIPKCILKCFVDSSHRVYYLDTKTGYIGLAGARKLGTEYGYYSDEQERFLNKEIETPVSLLSQKVSRWLSNRETILELPIAEEHVLKKYIAASMARSNFALESMQKSMGAYSRLLLSKQQVHDFISTFGVVENNGIYKVIESYYLVVLVNKTDTNWVVPRNCFYTVPSGECECIVAPISPRCALCLFPLEYAERNESSLSFRLGVVDEQNHSQRMNIRALQYEYIFNQTFVASSTKAELEWLKEYMAESQKELDTLFAEVRKKIKQ